MTGTRIHVEVVCVTAHGTLAQMVTIPAGGCVADALKQAPALPPGARLSVWGAPVGLDLALRGGERVEVCAALPTDPKSRRRKRAVNFRRAAPS